MSTATWHPCSPFERVDGYVWLKRMLAKARRKATDPMGDYVVFEASPLDAYALARWQVRGAEVQAWLDEGLDDEAIATRLAAHLGHLNLAARERWSRGYMRLYGLFMHMIEADEGRRAPGLVTSLMAGLLEAIFFVVRTRNRLLGRA